MNVLPCAGCRPSSEYMQRVIIHRPATVSCVLRFQSRSALAHKLPQDGGAAIGRACDG